ncbi:MAG: hypothetical protein GKR88_06530 [Flavobacteriaceae bacterium]|nr:MAG: hypothetical protein GKR88_06530 [Flavobacteriaceae bacterium]
MKQIVEKFSQKISDENSINEFNSIFKRLQQFEDLEVDSQEIADHLLAQIFRQLSQFIGAYRHILFNSGKE